MKSPPHGGINCSILDGWWPEAFDSTNGWVIGKADEGAANAAFQEADAHGAGVARDLRDVESLYQLLEKQMVGEFYDRGRDGLPRKWIKRALASAATIPDFFSTNRMVSEYATRAYGA
jgi:glucan phosphorylase